MTETAHVGAIGYDDLTRAEQVRDKIGRLGWDKGQAGKDLVLLDLTVVVRHRDGSLTLGREPFPGVANILACTGMGFLTGLVFGPLLLISSTIQLFIAFFAAKWKDCFLHVGAAGLEALAVAERKPIQEPIP